jgi:hypothetical protein
MTTPYNDKLRQYHEAIDTIREQAEEDHRIMTLNHYAEEVVQ